MTLGLLALGVYLSVIGLALTLVAMVLWDLCKMTKNDPK